jgi:hypothetical protein
MDDTPCARCGHDDPHEWSDGYCLTPVGDCQCDQCVEGYAQGIAPTYSDLCMCDAGVTE